MIGRALTASGVSIIEDGNEGITMELEMQWDGNPNIILDIKTYLGVALPVQVSCYFSSSSFIRFCLKHTWLWI